MMMAIAWNKFSHNESLHKSGSAYKTPHFLTNRRHVPAKLFHTGWAISGRSEKENGD